MLNRKQIFDALTDDGKIIFAGTEEQRIINRLMDLQKQNLQQTDCYAALEFLEQMLIEEQQLMNDKSLFFYQQGKHYEQARVLKDVIQAIKARQANAV